MGIVHCLMAGKSRYLGVIHLHGRRHHGGTWTKMRDEREMYSTGKKKVFHIVSCTSVMLSTNLMTATLTL